MIQCDVTDNDITKNVTFSIGYSIFIVRGEFPESESDQMLTLLPVDPTEVKSTSTRGKNKTVAKTREPPVGESKTGYFKLTGSHSFC